MSVRGTVETEWLLKLEGYKRAYKEVVGLPDKQADIAIKALDRQVRADEKAYKAKIQQAKAAEKAQVAAARKAAKEQVEAAKQVERAQIEVSNRAKDTFEAAGKVAGAFSGQLGSAFNAATNLGQGLGGLVSPAGLAAAGIGTVAFAATQAMRAMRDLVDSLDETVERLEQIEGVPPIPPHVLESLERWEQASLGAEAATLQLRAEIASGLEPVMTDLTHTMASAVRTATDVYRGLRDMYQGARQAKQAWDDMVASAKEALGPFGSVLFALYDVVEGARSFIAAGGLLGMVYRRLRDDGEAAADGLRDIAAATEEAREALDEYVRTAEAYLGLQEEVILGLTGATDEQVRYARAVERINRVVDERLASLEAEGALTQQAIADAETLRQTAIAQAAQLRDEAEARRQARDAAEQLAEARRRAAEAARQEAEDAAYVNEGLRIEQRRRQDVARATEGLRALIHGMGEDERTEAQRARERHLQRMAQIDELAKATDDAALIMEARAESEARLQRDLIDIRDRAHERAMQQAKELARQEQDAARDRIDAHMQVAGAMVGVISSVADLAAAKGREMSEDEKRRLQAAFRGQQLAMTGQIAMYTAAAIQRAMADLGPVAGGLAAGLITASGAAQVATVWAQPVPEFPRGGLVRQSPDHQLIAAQPGEGVVSRRGMERLGEDGLQRLNRGEPAAPQVLVIEQYYRHRPFDRFVRDNLSRPGPLGMAVSSGRTTGHSAR